MNTKLEAIVKRFCRFGFHQYGRWIDIEKGHLANKKDFIVGYYQIQEKRCVFCNKAKIRHIEKY